MVDFAASEVSDNQRSQIESIARIADRVAGIDDRVSCSERVSGSSFFVALSRSLRFATLFREIFPILEFSPAESVDHGEVPRDEVW